MRYWIFSVKKPGNSEARQVRVSRTIMRCAILSISLVMVFTSFAVYDYISLRTDLPRAHFLNEKVSSQERIIQEQNTQIQSFALEMNEMHQRLVALSKLEQTVRKLASITGAPQPRATGMGGLTPDDIFTRLEENDNHASLMREMHEQSSVLNAAAQEQEAVFNSLVKHLEERRIQIASIPSIRPLEGGRVTSRFGYRKSPFGSAKAMHKGLDIAAPTGMPIMATAAGIIISSDYQGYYGQTIVIDHGQGLITRYAHMSKLLVKRGDRVERGKVIGQVGSTGRTTGAHLHYEVVLNGVPVNPEKYILN